LQSWKNIDQDGSTVALNVHVIGYSDSHLQRRRRQHSKIRQSLDWRYTDVQYTFVIYKPYTLNDVKHPADIYYFTASKVW